MSDAYVIERLNDLAEFHAKQDSLSFEKQNLLAEVKVPDEVHRIIAQGNESIKREEAELQRKLTEANASLQLQLDAIVIPEEVKAILADIDRQRNEITKIQTQNKIAHQMNLTNLRETTNAEVQSKTAEVFKQLEQRKQEIEAEFLDKEEDVQANIEKLEEEIRDEVKKRAAERLKENPNAKDLSVKGEFFHAVYGKGRKTWIPAKLEKYTETHPDIKNCYTEGDPSVTIRTI